jgi:arginine decarboxylase
VDLVYVPSKIFFTKGVGVHKEKLQSFEIALRNAKIEKYNLVRVSSIFPPMCKVIPRSKGLRRLTAGQIVHCVLAEQATCEPNRLIVSSVGVAMPSDTDQYGYLSEHHAYGQTVEKAGDYAEDLAACMLATTLGIEFDEDVHWDERKELWKINNQIYKTRNITQSARGDKKGLWTTVIAAAVLIA